MTGLVLLLQRLRYNRISRPDPLRWPVLLDFFYAAQHFQQTDQAASINDQLQIRATLRQGDFNNQR